MKAKINEVSGIFLLPEHWPAQGRLPRTHISTCACVHEDSRFEHKQLKCPRRRLVIS